MYSQINKSTNKSFGIIFFIVFFLIVIYPVFFEENIRIWSILISLVFLILGIFNSKILTYLNKIWFKFGIFLGKIVSPVVMGAIFFFVVTPTGLLMKLFKKDILNLKLNNKKSYWIEKTEPKSKMRNQF